MSNLAESKRATRQQAALKSASFALKGQLAELLLRHPRPSAGRGDGFADVRTSCTVQLWISECPRFSEAHGHLIGMDLGNRNRESGSCSQGLATSREGVLHCQRSIPFAWSQLLIEDSTLRVGEKLT